MGSMKTLTPDALGWWWSLPEEQQLELELSCLEEEVELSEVIYLLSGQALCDLREEP